MAAEEPQSQHAKNIINIAHQFGDIHHHQGDERYNVHGLPNPYLGLRSFTYAQRAIYVGREQTVAAALDRLTGAGEEQTLLFITGTSGSGKSSLAQAGLIPALEAHYQQRKLTLNHVVLRPSQRPLDRLADALRQLGLELPLTNKPTTETITALLATQPPTQISLLVLDQFEELFTLSDPHECDRIIAWLDNLPPFAQLRTHIIATLRVDFLPEPKLY